MSHRITALALVLGPLVVAGCSDPRTVGGREHSTSGRCTNCHGDETRAASNPLDPVAPPRDIRGNTETTAITVGAHQSHVTGPHRITGRIGCETCHIVPSRVDDPSHGDGVKVSFGVTSYSALVSPSWDRSQATCAVYCHGATLSGGSATAPVWTQVDGSQVSCGSCHGNPPARPHPQRTDCRACHPATLEPGRDDAIRVEAALHIDGKVDVDYGSMGCTDCHGDAERLTGSPLEEAAPPLGTRGEVDASAVAVGAHQAHLVAGTIAKPVACAECHLVPTSPSHPNDAIDFAWGATATTEGAQPVWDRQSATCASTWCHGAKIGGGSNKTPNWTGGASQTACGTCHGLPPPQPHPASTQCSTCHPGTVKADGSLDVAGGLHVNGTVDANRFHPAGWALSTSHGYAANRDLASCKACHGDDLAGGPVGVSCDTCHAGAVSDWRTTCTFCHGDDQRAANKAAPPVGTQGELSTLEQPVGAHQAHLQGGDVRGGVACLECHVVPTDISHMTGVAELAWGTLATHQGQTAPAFANGTCSNVYCHGADLGAGGSLTEPLWTKVDGTQDACGTCHGAPPPSPHPQMTACRTCHAETILVDAHPLHTIDVAGGKHIDGTVQRTSFHPTGWVNPTQHGYAANRDFASCKTCHGADFAGGETGVSCNDCHASNGHAGWRNECTFCHGDASTGNAAPPVGTEGETATLTRAVGAHQQHLSSTSLGNAAIACTECHVVPADVTHLDGTATLTWAAGGLASKQGATPSFDGATCTNYCHGSTLVGGSLTTPLWTKVDGTQAQCGTCHALPPPFPHPSPEGASCAECHPETLEAVGAGFRFVPASAGGKHLSGVSEAARGHALSWMDEASPSFHAYSANVSLASCQTCHGATLTGGDSGGPCARCHDGAAAPAWNTCTTCHGTEGGLASPPRATWGNNTPADNTNVRIGAHAAHLTSDIMPAVGCVACHPVPADVFAAGHLGASPAEIAFTGKAANGATLWNRATATCTNECHGAFVAGGTNKTPSWTGGPSQAACGTCHGTPPPFPHPATPAGNLASCGGCHPDTVSAGGTIIAPTAGGKHLDGAVQFASGHGPTWMDPVSPNFHAYSANAGLFSCQSCHGVDLGGTATVTGCADCHNGTVAPAWNTCTTCHGGTNNTTGAPPRATWGNDTPSDSTNARIGAHTAHLSGASLGAPITCAECHLVPTDALGGTHLDGNGVAEVTFGGRAGLTASWNGASATCSSTYCHGSTLGGGTNTEPVWNGVGQAQCGSCHGTPPPSPHPAVSSALTGCSTCHPETVAANGTLIPATAGGHHVDGITQVASSHPAAFTDPASPSFHAFAANGDLSVCQACHGPDLSGGFTGVSCTDCHGATWKTNCTMCHGGTQNPTGAPPKATWGNNTPSGTTNVRIGAHTKHTSGNTLSNPLACGVCHVTPADALSPGHVGGGVATVTFAGLATADGATPTWTRATATCASTYCHGSSIPGGTAKTPLWTKVDGTQATCASCHGAPPVDGPLIPSVGGVPAHRFHTNKLVACNRCHNGFDPNLKTVDKSVHLDGKRDAMVRHCVQDLGDGEGPKPAFCDPTVDVGCTCSVTAVTDWNACGACHALFPPKE